MSAVRLLTRSVVVVELRSRRSGAGGAAVSGSVVVACCSRPSVVSVASVVVRSVLGAAWAGAVVVGLPCVSVAG